MRQEGAGNPVRAGYDQIMRSAVLPAALLCACAIGSAAPPPLPASPAWVAGQRASVLGPLSVGLLGPEMAPDALRDGVEKDLRSAGFELGDGGMQVVLQRFDRGSVEATVRSAGTLVERFVVSGDTLGCISMLWGMKAADNARCYANGLVAAMLQSDAVARAAGGHVAPSRPPVATSRPPVATAPPRQARVLALKGRLAVLDLRNSTKEITLQGMRYFTDMIRQVSLRVEPGLDIMTRENLLVLLQGRELKEGDSEVETGRLIGADQIVTGDIQKVGTKFKLTLRLHETKQGKLLASSMGSGKSIDELDDEAQKAAAELFAAP